MIDRSRLAAFCRPDRRRALVELTSTLVPLAIGLVAMVYCIELGFGLLTLGLALPVGLLMLRTFVIQHDCGHGSFFAARWANDLLGGLLGGLTLAPYAYWRRNHAHHHAHHGNLGREQLGGLETLTLARYRGLSRVRRLGYRLYRNPLVMLGLGPIYQFGLKHRLPLDIPRAWRREWLSAVVNDLALLGLLVLGDQTIGLARVMQVMIPVWMVALSTGIWLFHVQHQFANTYWQHPEHWRFVDAALRGSSFYDLPKPLDWLTGSIGYHHVHHLAPKVPMYRLAECHAAIPEFAQATRLNLRESFACARLRLWDEDQQRLISLAEGPTHSRRSRAICSSTINVPLSPAVGIVESESPATCRTCI